MPAVMARPRLLVEVLGPIDRDALCRRTHIRGRHGSVLPDGVVGALIALDFIESHTHPLAVEARIDSQIARTRPNMGGTHGRDPWSRDDPLPRFGGSGREHDGHPPTGVGRPWSARGRSGPS